MPDAPAVITAEYVDLAPILREKEFNRQSILKGPDWRWETARAEMTGDKYHTPYVPSTDPYVIIAKRLQYMMTDRCPGIWFQEKWAPAFEIIQVGTNRKYRVMRAELESAVMRGVPEGCLTGRVLWVTGEQYRLYKKLFFDVDGVVTVASWMEDNVFRPGISRHKGDMITLLKAYYGSGPVDPTGRMSSSEESFVLSGILNNERMRQASEYLLGNSNIPLDLYVGCMETALKDIEESRKKTIQESGTGAVTDKNLLDQLKAVTQRRTPDEIRKLLEMKASGVDPDFDMQYIRERWEQPAVVDSETH